MEKDGERHTSAAWTGTLNSGDIADKPRERETLMDRITQSLLVEFSSEHNIDSLREDLQFEHFTGYVTVRRHYGETFDSGDIVVRDNDNDGGGDTGIDAIAILVNGTLITDQEVFEDLNENSGSLDVIFIFVQAERSSSFETAKIGQFSYGVQDFFRPQPTLPRNQAIKDAAALMAAIYAQASKFKRANPICRLYYITTGRWIADQALEARRLAAIADLQSSQLFSDVDFSCLGASDIQRLYSQTRNAISREFLFSSRVEIPEMPGVTEAYLGHIPASQFLSMIRDDDGEIIPTIFYDNVRDWQEYNPVNTEIRETLDSDKRSRFVLMNNGITIIARTMQHTGSRFQIEDFQIVNGCQTSHVIFDNRDLINDAVSIPLRLIATQDEEVIEDIIRATNRQTEVKTEQFFAVTEFAKQLEIFFQSYPVPRKLFYERRSRQYDRLSVEKTRIVTPTNLIRAFAAMFLGEPHQTMRSYRLLSRRVGTDIFADGHRLEPYYVAAFALYRLEYMFRNYRLLTAFKLARYQLLLAARLLADPSPLPRMNAREMERYCQRLSELLADSDEAEKLFDRAAEVVKSCVDGAFDRDTIHTQPFTEKVIAACAAMNARTKT
jgi:AIPR protein